MERSWKETKAQNAIEVAQWEAECARLLGLGTPKKALPGKPKLPKKPQMPPQKTSVLLEHVDDELQSTDAQVVANDDDNDDND